VAAVKDGRSVVTDGDLAAAYSLGTTLALDYAVDQMVPRLAKAVA
jgi:iron complex transport system substrate-binding protein